MVSNKAVFLDRDGVINIDHGYVYRQQDFEFVPGVLDACEQLKKMGYLLVVITNQAGVARGYYSEEDVQQLHHWMALQFAEHQAPLDGIYYCPHHAEAGQGSYQIDCPWRKPHPGMLFKAAEQLGIDLSASILVGDKASDLEAAINAGVNQRILVGERLTNSPLATAQYPTLWDWVLGEGGFCR